MELQSMIELVAGIGFPSAVAVFVLIMNSRTQKEITKSMLNLIDNQHRDCVVHKINELNRRHR